MIFSSEFLIHCPERIYDGSLFLILTKEARPYWLSDFGPY